MKTIALGLAVVAVACSSSIGYAFQSYPPASLYVSTGGSDVTGNGSSGNPWATLTHALTALPQALDKAYTINVADGTYVEGVCVTGFTSPGVNSITVLGDLSSMDSVVYSGSCSYPAQRGYPTGTASILAIGPVNVNLEGLETTGAVTYGMFAAANSNIQMEHVDIESTGDQIGIELRDGVSLGLLDNNTVNVQSLGSTLYLNVGLEALYGDRVWMSGLSGTPTILLEAGSSGTSSSTPFIGVHLGYGSQMIGEFSTAVPFTLKVLNSYYGVQMGLASIFQIGLTNASTLWLSNPGVSTNKTDGSVGIFATDVSTFSVNQSSDITMNGFQYGTTVEALAYAEFQGGSLSRTNITNNTNSTTGGTTLGF